MIDPRISLAAQAPEFASGVTNAINIFENALMNSQSRDLRQKQEARAAELHPLSVQATQQGVDSNQQLINDARSKQRLANIHETGQRLKPILLSGDTQSAQKFMLDNISRLQTRIEQGSGEDIAESMDVLAKIQAGDVKGALADIDAVEGLVLGARGQGASAGTREFQNLLSIAQDPNATQLEQDSARRKLGDLERVTVSAEEKIASNAGLAQQVVDQKAAEAQATETGKSKATLKFRPQITRAVKLAEAKATEQGAVLTDLARAEAGLPGLIKATDNLKELASAATSTYGGRFFDAIAKESGWGSTKGANARAKYIAIIDNQVLPLLKQTFGGAMTEGEGAKLTNTFGDPNATPEQKMLQTEAFIEQKMRDIERLKTQANAGAEIGDAGQIMTDASGNRARVFADGTFEEL